MPPQRDTDDLGSLERARESLYSPTASTRERSTFTEQGEHVVPHAWEEKLGIASFVQGGNRHIRLATVFFGGAVAFFLLAVVLAAFFFYFGSNSVSADKISIAIQGPTTIAGGDTVPLSITITNKNPSAIEDAVLEINFPEGTRSATDVLKPYPNYVENLGTIAVGQTVTRSVRAVVFGGAGQTLTLPVSISYGTVNSNATFEKKTTYPLSISSTPLSVAVESLTEAVPGTPVSFTITVRSNATVPLNNIVLAATTPFGFSVTSSSVPLVNSSFYIGTLEPGASKQVMLVGTLAGQPGEQRVFHFTVGTSKSPKDQALAVTYMTQSATLAISSPFIVTKLAINGDTSNTVVVGSGSTQNVVLSYTNTLSTTVTNASVAVAIAGSGIDYDSIRTGNGFYNSSNRTVIFSKDTDPSLGSLAPGASGVGTFSFNTLAPGISSPTITFSISASGTRVGQSNVPEEVTIRAVKTVKVATAIGFTSRSSHALDPFGATGPIPPRADEPTSYVVIWNLQNKGNNVAGGTVTATLPSYVAYTGKSSGTGSFSYDTSSRVVTWTVGDLAQSAGAQGMFQVMLTPSTSQKGGAVQLVGPATFGGFDRFAGANVSASAPVVTTETSQDPDYVPGNATVQ